jgi:type II secretory pathway pseudopilin PulG
MKFILKNRGETIVEVLVATVLLVAVLAGSFVALNRASRANINVQNRIVAINLAREGVEIVRNIRDTNWLKYSGNRREKWLCFDSLDSPPSSLNECSGTGVPTTIGTGFYKIDFSESEQRYFLAEVFDAEILDIPNDSAELESFLLYIDATTGKFTYDSTDSGGADNELSPFYRQIDLTVLSDAVCGTECHEEKLKIIVRVGRRENEVSKNVVLETYLFDFYQRDQYEN